MSGVEFNPFTGTFDFVGGGSGSSFDPYSTYSCESDVHVGDAVRIREIVSGSAVLCRAIATTHQDSAVIGICVEKISANQCKVSHSSTPEIYTDLDLYNDYYLSDEIYGKIEPFKPITTDQFPVWYLDIYQHAGYIQPYYPDLPLGQSSIVIRVGNAISDKMFLFDRYERTVAQASEFSESDRLAYSLIFG